MLKFPNLSEAVFVSRPNRFLVYADIDDRATPVHLHDPGRLQELLVAGAKLYLQKANNPERKTRWDIILVKKGRIYVAIYSILANRLVKTLFVDGTFPGFKSWRLLKAEPAFDVGRVPSESRQRRDERETRRLVRTRFDFELGRGEERMLVEVKSVSLVEDGIAMFPDAPTIRGRRHLLELAQAVKDGYKAAVIFIVTRNDARAFKPHSIRDPEFAEALRYAAAQGVKLHCFKCDVSRKYMAIHSKIPVLLK